MSERRYDKQSRSDENRERYRRGQASKFAWIKAAGADRTLSDAAYRVLSLCAFHEAGAKGHWGGRRVHLAQICGMTVRKFDRAIAEGVARNYIDVDTDSEDRRAHKYYIIPVAGRDELFYDALNEWRNDYISWLDAERYYEKKRYREWLDAEKVFLQKWVDAEKAFVQEWLDAETKNRREMRELHRQVFDMPVARGRDDDTAYALANQTLDAVRGGHLPRETVQGLCSVMANGAAWSDVMWSPGAPKVLTTDGNNRAESGNYCAESGNNFAGSGTVVANPNALTSGSNQSPYAQVLEIPEVLEVNEASTRARPARCAASQEQPQPQPNESCPLCDGDGIFLDADGYPVELCSEDCDDLQVACQHSVDANIAYIRRLERDSGGYWGLGKTGWLEIDSHFPEMFDYDECIPISQTVSSAVTVDAQIYWDEPSRERLHTNVSNQGLFLGSADLASGRSVCGGDDR